MDGGNCKWTEEVANAQRRLSKWTAQAVNGRSRIPMDGARYKWTEHATTRRERLQVNGVGCEYLSAH